MQKAIWIEAGSVSNINHYLEKGWKVFSTTAGAVATARNMTAFGGFLVVLEKEDADTQLPKNQNS